MEFSEISIRYETVGLWKENSYIVEYNDESWIVDPGDEFNKINIFFNKTKFKGILNTHGHFDHVGAIQEFKEKYNIPFYIHSKDKRILYQANLYKKISGDNQICFIPQIDFFLDEVNELKISDKCIKIHSIPGHTEGSVCFEIDNNLIIGDLFFKNEIGRTDLPGGNVTKIKNSINYILDTFFMFNIYPGHGKPFVLTKETIFELKKKLG